MSNPRKQSGIGWLAACSPLAHPPTHSTLVLPSQVSRWAAMVLLHPEEEEVEMLEARGAVPAPLACHWEVGQAACPCRFCLLTPHMVVSVLEGNKGRLPALPSCPGDTPGQGQLSGTSTARHPSVPPPPQGWHPGQRLHPTARNGLTL